MKDIQMPLLEVRVPISPKPEWYMRARLIAASVREFYPQAIIRFYLGTAGGVTPQLDAEAAVALDGCDREWVPADEFDAWAGTRSEYIATMNRRFAGPVQGRYVLLLDADVLVNRRFDELFDVDAVMGVQAHVTPFAPGDWKRLFALAEVPFPERLVPYSGNGIMGRIGEMGPWYINSGVIFAPKHRFLALCDIYQDAIRMLRQAMTDTYWFDQLALALAAAAAHVPLAVLPLRYNYPNQRGFDEVYPQELDEIRFIHYLRTDTVHRDRDFRDIHALAALCRRTDLDGSNEVLRARVAHLLPGLMPPAVANADEAPYA